MVEITAHVACSSVCHYNRDPNVSLLSQIESVTASPCHLRSLTRSTPHRFRPSNSLTGVRVTCGVRKGSKENEAMEMETQRHEKWRRYCAIFA